MLDALEQALWAVLLSGTLIDSDKSQNVSLAYTQRLRNSDYWHQDKYRRLDDNAMAESIMVFTKRV